MSSTLAACLMIAAQTYAIPPAVLVGIYNVEGGAVGQQVRNTNGTYDLGPMQINTLWVPELADYWGVSESQAKKWMRDDPCTNMSVSAWILRQHLNETGSLGSAIAQYHSRTPHLGGKYRRKVVAAMEKNGLLRSGSAPRTGVPVQNVVQARRTSEFGKTATKLGGAETSTTRTYGFRPQSTVLAQSGANGTGSGQAGMNTIQVYNPVSRD